jgi:membrane-associated phospholipid phosphatase
VVGPLGKPWVHGPVTALLAAYTRPRSRAGAVAIVLSSGASAAVSHLFESSFPHRPAPPGKRKNRSEPSFPSGHSLETAATALTTAYVLAREGRADAWFTVPVSVIVPAISGAGRLVLDRHWTTDVVGGWLAGTAIAACCAAAYELMPD